jgi:hypothetical protein
MRVINPSSSNGALVACLNLLGVSSAMGHILPGLRCRQVAKRHPVLQFQAL